VTMRSPYFSIRRGHHSKQNDVTTFNTGPARLFLNIVVVCFLTTLLSADCEGFPVAHAFHHASPCVRSGRDPMTRPKSLASAANDIVAKNPKRVVIVGGGVGGLSTASRIAHALSSQGMSCQVTVLEKNPDPSMAGGRCGSTYVDVPPLGTFRHERGPSLLLLPDTYHELFFDCDSTAADHGLEISQCVPACKVVFNDGDWIDIGFRKTLIDSESPKDKEIRLAYERSRQKMDALESNGAAKWDAYMQATGAFLDCGLPNFIEEKLDVASFPSFAVEALRDGGKVGCSL
jgi:monoamine oxidase